MAQAEHPGERLCGECGHTRIHLCDRNDMFVRDRAPAMHVFCQPPTHLRRRTTRRLAQDTAKKLASAGKNLAALGGLPNPTIKGGGQRAFGVPFAPVVVR